MPQRGKEPRWAPVSGGMTSHRSIPNRARQAADARLAASPRRASLGVPPLWIVLVTLLCVYGVLSAM